METGYLAIVTGGAQGIGHGIAEALLQAGAKVYLLDIDAEKGVTTQKEFDEKFGTGKAKFLHCDVSKAEELKKAFLQAKMEMGGLNVICNNAGIACPLDERARWEEVLAINLGAVIHGSFLGIDLMAKNKGGNGGVIINTSSIAGIYPAPHSSVYSAAKSGMIGFTRSAAMTSPEGVRINCICPDFTETQLLHSAMKELQQLIPEDEAQEMVLEKVHHIDRKDQNVAEQTAPYQPIEIGMEVLKLVKEESAHGQILMISKNKGIYDHKFQ